MQRDIASYNNFNISRCNTKFNDNSENNGKTMLYQYDSVLTAHILLNPFRDVNNKGLNPSAMCLFSATNRKASTVALIRL